MWQVGQIVLAGQIVLVWHLDQIILVGQIGQIILVGQIVLVGQPPRQIYQIVHVGQIGFQGADLSDRSCVVDRSHGADRFE